MKNKKSKKCGWTLAEIMIVMVILSILAGISMQTIKPKRIKLKPFAYSAVQNLSKGNLVLLQQSGATDLPNKLTPESDPTATLDSYCMQIYEIFNTTGIYNCARTALATTANFQLTNRIAYHGLAGEFNTTDEPSNKARKPAMFDIDGDKGDNTVGIDRIPVWVYQNAKVIPMNCTATGPAGFNNTTYCAGKTTNFIGEKNPIAYNVFVNRPATQEDIDAGKRIINERLTELLKSDISFFEADCLSNATPSIIPSAECTTANYKPACECTGSTAEADGCKDNTVVEGFCIVRLAKPAGAGFFSVEF